MTEKTLEVQGKNSSFNFKQFKSPFYNILTLLIFCVVWQIGATMAASPFIPTPADVWSAALKLIAHGDVEGYSILDHINASLIRILVGFGLAAVMGVPLGLWMGLKPKFYEYTRALIEPIRFIPPIAWIPMAIVLLVGFQRYVFLIWLGAFFPIFINTLVSVPRVNPVYLNVSKVFGATRFKSIWSVVIPTVLPDIFSGMRVGLGMAWMCIVAAEMIGGESIGVGRMILKYSELLKLGEVITGMLIIGIIGFLMNEILLRVEKKLFAWRWEVSI